MVNRNSMDHQATIQTSSGNVFADLGFNNADELLAKAELVRQISNLIAQQQMTQAEAAKKLGMEEDALSDLIKGKLSSFSEGQLAHFLNILRQNAETTVKAKPQSFSLIPQGSKQILDNFLAFLQNPNSDLNAYSRLPILEDRLTETEDKPTKLALTIKKWCKEFGIDFSEAKLAPVRGNMPQKDETIPNQTADGVPEVTYDKSVLVEQIKKVTNGKDHE
ncbi:MAG: helix-turn-helix transcriptional regulator [Halothece sp. Uz-M2-17]|nr:helix-turn-helix transcriptional regulator [Halothece sp. Uz-M2-17]